MATIGEQAKEYEPATLGNIADLPKVSTALEMTTETFKEGTEDEFKVKVIEVEGSKYRVPTAVIGNLKALLSENSNLKSFKVRKDGQGMATRYTVIPLE